MSPIGRRLQAASYYISGPAPEYSDTFTGANGSTPSAQWRITANSGSATIQNNALALVPAGTAWALGPAAYLIGQDGYADSEVLLDITMANPKIQQYVSVALRSDGTFWPSGGGASQSKTGYVLNILPHSNSFQVIEAVTGNVISSTVAFTWTAGVTYRIRYKLADNYAFVKIWDVATAEPGSWAWEDSTASIITSGKLYIATMNGPSGVGTVTVDNVQLYDASRVSSPIVAPATMPTGNYTDPDTGTVWVEAWANDFDTAVAAGAANWDPGAQGRLPLGNPYRDIVNCYERPISSTSGLSRYYTARTTWTANSIFHINMHSEVIPETGSMTGLGGTLVPRLPSYFSKFIRAQWRFRVTNTVNNGDKYGLVWQSINSNHWPEYGEHDFPEGAVDGRIVGNFHPATTGPDSHTQYTTDSPVYYDTWRTFTSQWEPNPLTGGTTGRLRWWVGTELIMDRISQVGASPMVFMLQCADNGAVPDPATVAELQVDWVKIWVHPEGSI
ncbi:MAG: hypothetical protein WBP26_00665 [Candidatus Saccharimonadales bacterium]